MSPELERISALGVYLEGSRIGVLSHLPGDRHLFAFDRDYVDDPGRPTLSLSYKSNARGVVTAVKPVSRRLPPFFSNLLPEGPLREYLAEKAGVKKEREFYLLAVLGADLPGGVVVRPLDGDAPELPHDGEPHEAEDPQTKEILRFSLAGVQLKFSAVLEASGGLTIPAHGVGGSWIVKLPSSQFAAVPENEFVMLELARAIGIEVPPIRLVPVSEIQNLPPEAARLSGNALAVQRFDRAEGDRRIHMEDFAQVFGLFPESKYRERSYANIARVLWAEAGEAATSELVRRLVFSVITGNGDMHLKNWSLLYPDGRTPVLSPAYDLVSTVPYIPGDTLALAFGATKSLSAVTPHQLQRFANSARLPLGPLQNVVRETVRATENAWRDHAAKDLLPGNLRRAIDAHISAAIAGSS